MVCPEVFEEDAALEHVVGGGAGASGLADTADSAPRYGHQGVAIDDLIDFTPQLRAEAEAIVAKHRIGPIYTPAVPFDPNGPLSTLMVMGGSNWPGGSDDPESHIVYVTASVGPGGQSRAETESEYEARMPNRHAFVVRKDLLNAGATLNYVQLDDRSDQDQRYYVHKQLYKTLLLISSVAHRTGQISSAPALMAPGQQATVHGGSLDGQRPAVGETRRPAIASSIPSDRTQTGATRRPR